MTQFNPCDRVKIKESLNTFDFIPEILKDKIGVVVTYSALDDFLNEEENVSFEYLVQFDFEFDLEFVGMTDSIWIHEEELELVPKEKREIGFAKFIKKIEGEE